MADTEILAVTELASNQKTPEVTVNAALRQLEGMLVHVKSWTTTAEPGSPTAGDVYIVPSGATGTNWSGQDGKIAHYYNSAWTFYAPTEGLRLWADDKDRPVKYDGSAWGYLTITPQFPTSSKSGNYTVTASDAGAVFLVDASGGAVTITCPDSATVGNGFTFGVVKIDSSANAVTVSRAGTDTIEGSNTLALSSQWSGTLLDTDGAGEFIQIGGGGGGTSLPIADGQDLFEDNSDSTKILRFELSGIATGTTRTATWPDKDGTIAMLDDVVGKGRFVGFGAYASTVQSLTAATATKLQLDTEEFDSDGWFDHSTNYRFTPQTEGYYLVGGAVSFNAASGDNHKHLYIYKNGSLEKVLSDANTGNAADITVSGSALVYLNGSSDYVELYAESDDGDDTLATANQTYGWGLLVIAGSVLSDQFNEDSSTTTGLTWGFLAGELRVDATITSVSAGTVTLTDDSTNYVELDPSAGTMSANTTGFTDGQVPIRQVVASSGSQTSSTDKRAWIVGDQVFYASGLTAELACADQVVSRPELKDYAVTHTTPTISSGAVTFDCANGNSFNVSLTENITSITLSNPPASGNYGEIVIEFKQDATGSRTVSGWPASVKWAGGSAPTITSAANSIDKVVLSTRDGGATWLGDYSQDYS